MSNDAPLEVRLISQGAQQTVLDGWKLVPIDATDEMVDALKARIGVTSRGGILNAGHALNAAISAAPTPPAQQSPDELRRLKAERDRLYAALAEIVHWPDGGRRYGQKNIKAFAEQILELGDTAAPEQAEHSHVEVLGKTCIDGGACHHRCTERCFRRESCAPFSDYSGPWAYGNAPEQAEQDAVKVPRELISRLVAGLEWALPELNMEPFEWSSGEAADAHRAAIDAVAEARALLGGGV